MGAKHTFVTGRVRALATCDFGTLLFCVESYHCIVCNEEFTRSYNFKRHCDSAGHKFAESLSTHVAFGVEVQNVFSRMCMF